MSVWHIVEVKDETLPTENWEAIHGPFHTDEIETRINDAFADCLAMSNNLYAVVLTESELQNNHINPPEFWMSQLEAVTAP